MSDQMIRVYRLPEQLTNGFCFADGNPVTFLNVDWFDAPPPDAGFTRVALENFIRQKNYFHPGARYLVLDDRDGQTFVIGRAQ